MTISALLSSTKSSFITMLSFAAVIISFNVINYLSYAISHITAPAITINPRFVIFMQIFFVSLLKVTALLLSIVHSLLLSIHTTVQNTSACFIIVECGLVIVAISIKNIFSSVRVGLIAVGYGYCCLNLIDYCCYCWGC